MGKLDQDPGAPPLHHAGDRRVGPRVDRPGDDRGRRPAGAKALEGVRPEEREFVIAGDRRHIGRARVRERREISPVVARRDKVIGKEKGFKHGEFRIYLAWNFLRGSRDA